MFDYMQQDSPRGMDYFTISKTNTVLEPELTLQARRSEGKCFEAWLRSPRLSVHSCYGLIACGTAWQPFPMPLQAQRGQSHDFERSRGNADPGFIKGPENVPAYRVFQVADTTLLRDEAQCQFQPIVG